MPAAPAWRADNPVAIYPAQMARADAEWFSPKRDMREGAFEELRGLQSATGPIETGLDQPPAKTDATTPTNPNALAMVTPNTTKKIGP
jgi:hypothetical protein